MTEQNGTHYPLIQILNGVNNGFPLKSQTIIKNDLNPNGVLKTDANKNVTAGPITISKISDFPSTMTPSAHNHSVSDITDFPTTLQPGAHTHTTSDITNFPSTMTPSAHNHTVSEITDFPSTMTPSAHNHTVSEITDFPSTMTPSAHNHSTTEITSSAAYNYLGTPQNASQATINGAINTKIGELKNIELLTVVASLPTASTNTMNKLYLVARSSSSANNVYDIYITVKSGSSYNWEKIDDASLSLGSYAKLTDLPTANTVASNIKMNGTANAGALNTYAKADHIHPSDTNKSKVTFSRSLSGGTKIGTINIDGTNTDLFCQTNTDTTYTAGAGLSLAGNQFKHSNSVSGGALTTASLKKIKYDAQGHLTGVANVEASDLPAHAHGNLQSDGKITPDTNTVFSYIATLDSNKKLTAGTKLNNNVLIDSSTYPNIGVTSANKTQKEINAAINNTLSGYALSTANITNWATSTTTGGNAKTEGCSGPCCFGQLYKQGKMVTLYLRLLSKNPHENTSYQDYVIPNGIPNGFKPAFEFYQTFSNLNDAKGSTALISTDGSIRVRAAAASSTNPTQVNVYSMITYPTS